MVDYCAEEKNLASEADAAARDALADERKAKIAYARTVWTYGKSWGALMLSLGAPTTAPGVVRAATSGGIFALGNFSEQQTEEARNDYLNARRRAEEALAEAAKARAAALECMKQKPAECGSKGGPGWRRPSGKCASWSDLYSSSADD